MFSKTCEHGIKASIYIANQSKLGFRVKVQDVAKETNSPVAFTAKILQTLVKHALIISHKGPQGGFNVDVDKLESITLLDLVFAIDGDSIYNGCGLGLHVCNESNPCPVHFKFKVVRDELKTMLLNTTLAELAQTFAEGKSILKYA